MSELREALALQREALTALKSSRADATAWTDDQRVSLDKGCLDPLTTDGQRLYDAMKRISDEILSAQRMVAE